MPPKESLKRKDPPKPLFTAGSSSRHAKRAKAQDARTIRAQPADKAINEKGELDVAAFVKARQFEIEALEESFKTSKHGLMSRAFQEVPRQLRRRTASHNVKKVPRRLRVRAAKEMKEDNTPTGSARTKDLTTKQRVRRETAKKAALRGAKARAQREALGKVQQAVAETPTEAVQRNVAEASTATVTQGNQAPAAIHPVNPPQGAKGVLTKAPKPVSKFRNRQKEKTWLPTHIFHAKRAQMTLPNHPLWRFAIPMTSTERSYRITHRAANMRGCIAWDTSYMGTVLLEGETDSLLGALRALGVPEPMLTGAAGVKWRAGSRTWTGWLRDRDRSDVWISRSMVIWCADDSDQDVSMTDEGKPRAKARRRIFLRVHPASFLQSWREVLKVSKMQRPQVSILDLRFEIGSIEIEGPDAAEALAGILHPFEDPMETDSSASVAKTLLTLARVSDTRSLPSDLLLTFSMEDPRLKHPPRRLDLSQVSDQDVVNLQTRWPTDSSPGLEAAAIFDSHARFASCRLQSSQKAINRRHGEAGPAEYPKILPTDPRIPALLCTTTPSKASRHGSWTLMVPWHWVSPIWNSLMYFPLSTGSNPRFGGLLEKHQLAFEHGEPFFPADFPGTSAGWEWEMTQRKKRQDEHERKPKAKRVEYSKLDLCNGQRKGEVGGDGWACSWDRLFMQAGSKKAENKNETVLAEAKDVRQVLSAQLANPTFKPSFGSILTVRLHYIQRGVPATCARIYRLPAKDTKLKARWVKLLEEEIDEPDQRKLKSSKMIREGDGNGKGKAKGDGPSYPPVPGEADLIGFVTTGNFNLAEGKGTAIGSVALQRIWSDDHAGKRTLEGICLVRNAGTAYGRLAKWSSV